jgi:hypothetical protein
MLKTFSFVKMNKKDKEKEEEKKKGGKKKYRSGEDEIFAKLRRERKRAGKSIFPWTKSWNNED